MGVLIMSDTAQPAPALAARQQQLRNAVTARAAAVEGQLLLLAPQARACGASEADVTAVRDALLHGRTRVCRDW
jgi:hypothetical protein